MDELLDRYFTGAEVTARNAIENHLIAPSDLALYSLEDIANEEHTDIFVEEKESDFLTITLNSLDFLNYVSLESERSRVAMVHFILAKLSYAWNIKYYKKKGAK